MSGNGRKESSNIRGADLAAGEVRRRGQKGGLPLRSRPCSLGVRRHVEKLVRGRRMPRSSRLGVVEHHKPSGQAWIPAAHDRRRHRGAGRRKKWFTGDARPQISSRRGRTPRRGSASRWGALIGLLRREASIGPWLIRVLACRLVPAATREEGMNEQDARRWMKGLVPAVYFCVLDLGLHQAVVW